MRKIGISRRRFMKSSLAAFMGAYAGFNFPQKNNRGEGKAVSRTSLKNLEAIPTTCSQCPAGCGIIAYLNGEKLVQILGNPDHPVNRGGICAKGIAALNLVNDPERLLYPMKRGGPRGSGRWTRITWDEAYTLLTTRIKELLQSGKTGELVIDSGQQDELLLKFVSALGGVSFIDREKVRHLNTAMVLEEMTGSSALIEDVARSRTVLNFGANPFANHDRYLGLAQRLVFALAEKGARLVTFDVRLSETASLSHAWYPVKAGTDAAAALAMARVIVEEGLADKQFIERETDVSLSRLRKALSAYTPEFGARESGLSAEVIVKLAREFATIKPSLALFGGGISDHVNGSQNVHSIMLLNMLVGNLEKEGGLFYPRKFSLSALSTRTDDPLRRVKRVKGISELQESGAVIDTYLSFFSNPAFSEAECDSAAMFLKDEKKVGLVVVMDTHMTETASLADVVLPAAAFLESWKLEEAPSLDNIAVLNLTQPAVSLVSEARRLRSPEFEAGKMFEPSFKPLGEAREAGNVCLELARRIGGKVSRALTFRDTKDFAQKAAVSLLGKEAKEPFSVLKSKGFWSRSSPPRNLGKERIKIILSPKETKTPLPEYRPILTRRKREKNEFVLTTFKSNLWSEGTGNSKWAREILHQNLLWINKNAARKLGIKNGERVRVSSSAGTLITQVLTTERIHPQSVALAEGLGHEALGKVARAKKWKSKDRDTYLIWWEKKGKGVNPYRIMERKKDPISGGPGLKDTVVRIEKIEG